METLHTQTKVTSTNIQMLGECSIAKRQAFGAIQSTDVLLYSLGGKPNSLEQKNPGADKPENFRFKN